MRQSFKTTELWFTLLVCIGLGCLPRLIPGFPVCWALYYINALGASYIVARVLFKKNRGIHRPGLLTSELWIMVGSGALTCFETFNGFYPMLPSADMVGHVVGTGIVTGLVVLYNLARGLTKTMGVKTQLIQI